MTPNALAVGMPYPGMMLDHDSALFEFSKSGPELRLFFSGIPDAAVDSVQHDDCYFGLLRSGDIAVVPWRIGTAIEGDAQFHVFLYPPETRPTPEILDNDTRYAVQIILVDRDTGVIRALRSVILSPAFSKLLNEILAAQLGTHIGREEYDAQVDIYQNHYPSAADAIKSALIFEKAEG